MTEKNDTPESSPKLVAIDCKESQKLTKVQEVLLEQLSLATEAVKKGEIVEIVMLYVDKEKGYRTSVAGVPYSYHETLYHLERSIPAYYESRFILPPEEE